ncbi:MAG: hypothetical protein [Circular genetic element sp.]|nr:MAG: hypothetical protein [Circular genetic element sp.]
MRLHLLWVLALRTCNKCQRSLFICTCRIDFQIRAVKQRQKKAMEVFGSLSNHVWCRCPHDTGLRTGCCEQLPGQTQVCFCQPHATKSMI